MKLYQQIARLLHAVNSCQRSGNTLWEGRHKAAMHGLIKKHMPSGSGFDLGTELEVTRSTPGQLIFVTAFHVMKEGGYTGWVQYRVTVRASLLYDIDVQVRGPDPDGLRAFVQETFHSLASVEIDPNSIYPKESS